MTINQTLLNQLNTAVAGAAGATGAGVAVQNEVEGLFEAAETVQDQLNIAATGTNAAVATNDLTTEIAALQAEIAAKQAQIEVNNKKINELNTKLTEMKTQIEENIAESVKKIEDITDDQKTKVKQIVADTLDEVEKQSGDNPKTYTELLGGKIETANIGADSQIAKVINDLTTNNVQIATMENLVGQVTTLNTANTTLGTEIQTLNTEIAEKQAVETTKSKSCDPIGFKLDDGSTIDLFVDKDNNGDLSNEKEFLGADNQWNEMASLDTDGDNKVSKAEMVAGNLFAYKKDAQGNRTVQNVSDLFGDEDFIDLSSYKDSNNKDIGNGNVELGTFSLTMSGAVNNTGYNTLDNIDWLKNNYQMSDYAAGTTGGNTSIATMITGHQEAIQKLKKDNNAAWLTLGVESSDADKVALATNNQGKVQADTILNEIEEKFKKEQDDVKEKEVAATAAQQALAAATNANADGTNVNQVQDDANNAADDLTNAENELDKEKEQTEE